MVWKYASNRLTNVITDYEIHVANLVDEQGNPEDIWSKGLKNDADERNKFIQENTKCITGRVTRTDDINTNDYKITFNDGKPVKATHIWVQVYGVRNTSSKNKEHICITECEIYKTTCEHTETTVQTVDKKQITSCTNCNAVIEEVDVCTVITDKNISNLPATLMGGGVYKPGDKATLVASAVPGYNFLGWYLGEAETEVKVSGKYTCTVEVTEDTEYIAKYEPVAETVTLTIGNSDVVACTDSNGEEITISEEGTVSVKPGTTVTLQADTANFIGWQNVNKVYVSRDESAAYTFVVTEDTTLTPVYNTATETGKVHVVFTNYYGQEVDSVDLSSADAESFSNYPSVPTRYGYTNGSWFKGEETLAKAIASISEGNVLVIAPKYEEITTTYNVNVTNGTADKESYILSDIVRVTATPGENTANTKFSHWENAKGDILSYNESYAFYMVAPEEGTTVNLKAVYVTENDKVAKVGVTEILDMTETGDRMSFVSLSTVPEGYTIHKAGVIVALSEKTGGLTDKTADYIMADTFTGKSYRYTLNIKKGTTAKNVVVRSYLVYGDGENVYTVYGDEKPVTISAKTVNQ